MSTSANWLCALALLTGDGADDPAPCPATEAESESHAEMLKVLAEIHGRGDEENAYLGFRQLRQLREAEKRYPMERVRAGGLRAEAVAILLRIADLELRSDGNEASIAALSRALTPGGGARWRGAGSAREAGSLRAGGRLDALG